MPLLNRVLEAATNSLLITLLAPPVASLVFLVVMPFIASDSPVEFESGIDSLLLLFLGTTAGAYLIGSIPAFLAGLIVPFLNRKFPPLPAALISGFIGAVEYFLTFGSHLISGKKAFTSILIYGLPVFIGVAVASFLTQRILGRKN